MDDPLMWVRAAHFAATIVTAGTLLFSSFIAEPALRRAGAHGYLPTAVRSWLRRLAWIALVVVIISGAVWFLLVAARMADLPFTDSLSTTVWAAATDTGFGRDWIVRLVLSGLLTASLLWSRTNLRITSVIAICSAVSLVGTLAWAGHGAAGSGTTGAIHLVADFLHLIAACAWVGALVPLALFLGVAGHETHEFSLPVVREGVLRFSILGMLSVSTLLVTGVVNSLFLIGSWATLFVTDYGRLLLVKIALFLVMLAIAGVNRTLLTPRLAAGSGTAARTALRQLRNNSLIEATIGALILVIIGALGILPPGISD